MRRLTVIVLLAACGDSGNPVRPDAPLPDAVTIDAPMYPACREFAGTRNAVPAHIVGSLAGADVQSPQCARVEAPYGVESVGADAVIPLEGLTVGTAYIVRLASAADLAFYVATGCTTPSGPAPGECALFVDANATGDEVGRFVATHTGAFVIVDHYASAPTGLPFTLDVFAEACDDDSDCSSGLPVCLNGSCVSCADSFDCTDPALPRCDTATTTCIAGVDTCDSDDPSEPEDDGPPGAVALVPNGSGAAVATGQICSAPRTEADFYSFQVMAIGETWELSLSWAGNRNLRLELYTASGTLLGLSYWERPELVRLTYLPIGTYYVKVSDFAATSAPVAYTLSAQRTAGSGCSSRADCATEYRNQLFRGSCSAGACVPLAGNAMVAQGGACDSVSDCASALSCPSFYFVANADTRNVCAPTCDDTSDCAALGADYVCTTYSIQNRCVQKCTSDEQCPVDIDTQPVSGPWYRLRCQASTGRCVP